MWRPIPPLLLALALAACGEAPYERRVAWVPEDHCVRPDCSEGTSLTGRGSGRARVSYRELPAFDIVSTCKASVTFQSSEDDRYCLADERAAEKQLRAQWASFQPAERQSCIEQSASLEPSYVETLTCLEMSKETKARAKTFTKPPGSGVETPPPGPTPPPAVPRPEPTTPAPPAVVPSPAPAAPTAPPETRPTVPDAGPRPEATSPEPVSPGPTMPEAPPNAAPTEPWPGLDEAPKAEPPR